MEAKQDRAPPPDYGDDYDDYVQDRRRKLFSIVQKERNKVNKTAESQTLTGSDDKHQPRLTATKPVERPSPMTSQQVQQATFGLKEEEWKGQMDLKVAALQTSKPQQVNPGDKENAQGKAKAAVPSKPLGSKTGRSRKPAKKKRTQVQKLKRSKSVRKNGTSVKYVTVAEQKPSIIRDEVAATQPPVELGPRKTSDVKQREEQKDETKMTLPQNSEKSTNTMLVTSERRSDGRRSGEKEEFQQNQRDEFQQNQREDFKLKQEDYKAEDARPVDTGKREGDPVEEVENAENADNTAPLVFVKEINWSQTFQVDPLDLQEQRSDRIDLNCNISGNMLLGTKDALFLVQAFMTELHKKHPG